MSMDAHNTNGHQNLTGGNGGVPAAGQQIIDDLQSRRHVRETYIMLARAMKSGLEMPEGCLKAAVASAIIDLKDEAGSTRARAREFLLSVQNSAATAAVNLDKLERLDGGEETERVGHRVYAVEFDRRG